MTFPSLLPRNVMPKYFGLKLLNACVPKKI